MAELKWYPVSADELRRLRAVATRLYAERRMDGNEMRDLGHVITAVVKVAEDMGELFPAEPPKPVDGGG